MAALSLREARRQAEVERDLGDLGGRRDDPRGHLESELVDAKTVGHDVIDVVGDAVAIQIEDLERRVVVQDRRERARAFC